MERRRLLGAVGTTFASGVAGCLSMVRDDSGEQGCEESYPFGSEPVADSPADGWKLSITTGPAEPMLEDEETPVGLFTTGHVVAHPTVDEPGRIKLAVINDVREDREFEMGPTPPFSTYRGSHEEEESALYVVPYDRSLVTFENARSEACPAVTNVEADAEVEPVEIGSCASQTREYDVFADAEGDCFEPGEYFFRGTWNEHKGTLQDEEIVWEFTLIVEDV